MTLRFVVVMGAFLFAAACRQPGSSPTCNAQIDWVNFIQVGSAQYVAGPSAPTVLHEGDLGPVVAHVKFKVSGSVCDPSYRLKDGDAAFLDAGTPIYEVKGHPAAEQLAARFGGQIVVYEPVAPASRLSVGPIRPSRAVSSSCSNPAKERLLIG
jgi:hypothetical protein